MLNCIAAIAVIIVFAFALHSLFGIKAPLTPLVSLAVLVNIASIFAMFDLLLPGVFISYGVALMTFIYSCIKNKATLKEKLASFFSPGVILFIISCVAMLLFLQASQPMFCEWDEFSFWGISKKLVHMHGQLYTYYTSSMIGNSTPPTLAVLSYFFGWAVDFSEWICFFSYDVMFFACFCAFTAGAERENWGSQIAVYLTGFLLPFFFELIEFAQGLESVYISTYADIPLGLMFGGSLAVYFFSEKNDGRDVWPLIPIIAFYTLIKDMGFALSCIVIFIAFFDMWIGKKEFTFLKLKGFFAKCAAAAVMLITAGASFFGWSFHMAKVMARNPFELGGETNMSMVGMLIAGVKELLIGPKSEKFVIIQQEMITAFFRTKVSFWATGIIIVGMITALYLVAFILNDKNGRKRTVMMYITTWTGFIGYYVFHLFLYVYIFKDNAYGLASYNRYIYPYYIGWIASGIFVLLLATRNGKGMLAKASLLGFVIGLLVLINYCTIPENFFTGVNSNSYHMRKSIAVKADYIRDAISKDDIVYLYSGQDDGQRWFNYTYELAEVKIIPNQDFIVTAQTAEEEKLLKRQQMYDRFKQHGVTHVIIDWSSHDFIENFGDMFDVPINDIGSIGVACYKVNYSDNRLSFQLVKGGNVTYD